VPLLLAAKGTPTHIVHEAQYSGVIRRVNLQQWLSSRLRKKPDVDARPLKGPLISKYQGIALAMP
jgi:hypothetical protein